MLHMVYNMLDRGMWPLPVNGMGAISGSPP